MTQTAHFQRSRDGCLTCKKNRKKCDEKQPRCSRCERTRAECTWPIPLERQPISPFEQTTSTDTGGHLVASTARVRTLTNTREAYHVPALPTCFQQTLAGANNTAFETWTYGSSEINSDRSGTLDRPISESATSSNLSAQSIFGPPSDFDMASVTRNSSTSSTSSRMSRWEYAQEYAPVVVWPLENGEDNAHFDPEGVMPVLRHSITKLCIPGDLLFQEVHNFYSVFLPRYIYNYAAFDDSMMDRIRRRFEASDALKRGLLGIAITFRSNYERSALTPSLRNHAKELYLLAIEALQNELADKRIPAWIKLAGLLELGNQEYFAGNFISYHRLLEQGASVIRGVLGDRPIDLLSLNGEPAFDILWFAWCDILSSMALSRPTLLNYESDIRNLPRTGPIEPSHNHSDRGIESIFSCPDILAVLLARTITLGHAPLSAAEKTSRGKEIESLIRRWQFQPMAGNQSIVRVARLGTQEIWRHTAILYVHQSILKSDPSDLSVKESVKTIIRIANTLTPGVNPDCFLPVPYFIAGFFAASEQDRYTLRGRVLSCGNECLQRALAAALDDLWKEMDSGCGSASWSRNRRPTFIF